MRAIILLAFLVLGLTPTMSEAQREPRDPIDRPPRWRNVPDYAAQKRIKDELWHKIYALKEQKRHLEVLKPQLLGMFEGVRSRAFQADLNRTKALSDLKQAEGQRSEIREAYELLANLSQASDEVLALIQEMTRFTYGDLQQLMLELQYFLRAHRDLVEEQISALTQQIETESAFAAGSDRIKRLEARRQRLMRYRLLPIPSEPSEDLDRLTSVFRGDLKESLVKDFGPVAEALLAIVFKIQSAEEGTVFNSLELEDRWIHFSEDLKGLTQKWEQKLIQIEFQIALLSEAHQTLSRVAQDLSDERDALSRRMGTIDSEIAGVQAQINDLDAQWQHVDKHPPTQRVYE